MSTGYWYQLEEGGTPVPPRGEVLSPSWGEGGTRIPAGGTTLGRTCDRTKVPQKDMGPVAEVPPPLSKKPHGTRGWDTILERMIWDLGPEIGLLPPPSPVDRDT